MNDAKGGHTHGRRKEGDAGQQRTLYFLCIVSCGGVIYRFTSHTDRRPCTGGRGHSSFHGITRPRPKVSLPPHPRAPHVACESFGSERQVREDNRIRHRYKTNRKEEEDFTERKEGGMDGGRVGGRGRRCRAHRPSRLAPLATRGGDHDTWRGILGRIAFFHRFHATRAVDAAEETRRSLA